MKFSHITGREKSGTPGVFQHLQPLGCTPLLPTRRRTSVYLVSHPVGAAPPRPTSPPFIMTRRRREAGSRLGEQRVNGAPALSQEHDGMRANQQAPVVLAQEVRLPLHFFSR